MSDAGRAALVLALVAGVGCNQVFSLDPPSGRDGGAIDASGDASGLVDADDDAAGHDAAGCDDTAKCYRTNGVMETACSNEPIASCDADQRFAYCRCGSDVLSARSLFIVPSQTSGPLSDVILIGEPGLGQLWLQIDTTCVGATGLVAACELTLGPCAGSLKVMYRWRDVAVGPGSHHVALWKADSGAPCVVSGGGRVIFETVVVRD